MRFMPGDRVEVPGLLGGWKEGTVKEVTDGKPKVRPDYEFTSRTSYKARPVTCGALQTNGQFGREVSANRYANSTGDVQIQARSAQYARNTPATRAGFVFEQWHVESFNKNAIAQGSPCWAHMSKPGSVEDAVIINMETGKEVSVQFKRYADAQKTQRALNKPKYDGMQRVGPKDHAGNGVSDCMEYCGVKSDPLTKKQLDAEAQKPGGLIRKDAEATLWSDVRSAAAKGAAVSGGVSALYSGTAWARGKIDGKDCAKQVATGAAIGVGVGAGSQLAHAGLEVACRGAGRAVPIVGAIVSGASNIYSMCKEDDVGEFAANAAELSMGTCATVAFLAGSGPAGWGLMASGVLGGWACRLVKAAADDTRRELCAMQEAFSEAWTEGAKLLDEAQELAEKWHRDYDEAERLLLDLRRQRQELIEVIGWAAMALEAPGENGDGNSLHSEYDYVAASMLEAANEQVDHLFEKIKVLHGHFRQVRSLIRREANLASQLEHQHIEAMGQAGQAMRNRESTRETACVTGALAGGIGVVLAPFTFGFSLVPAAAVAAGIVNTCEDSMNKSERDAQGARNLAQKAKEAASKHRCRALKLEEVEAEMDEKIKGLIQEANSSQLSLQNGAGEGGDGRINAALSYVAVEQYRLHFALAAGQKPFLRKLKFYFLRLCVILQFLWRFIRDTIRLLFRV